MNCYLKQNKLDKTVLFSEDGCTSNATCTADQACIGTKRSECQDICHIKECAHFAECIAKDHSATCKCFAGYSGDPEGESCLPSNEYFA